MTTTTTGRTILATRPLMGWRTIDLLFAAFLGVALGVVFWGWSAVYSSLYGVVATAYPPVSGVLLGGWLLGGVVGGLVIRRPGAALFVELVAALVEALLGSHFGITAVYSGLLQGLGAELGFALAGYRRFGLPVAMLAGLLSVPLEMVYERFGFAEVRAWDVTQFLVYVGCCLASGLVVAGIAGWALTKALAGTGALRAFPPGQEVAEAGLRR